jgi:hypothetical protein
LSEKSWEFVNRYFMYGDFFWIVYANVTWKSEGFLFNTKWAIFQLYHDEYKLYFWCNDDDVRFVLHQHVKLDFHSASFLKHHPHIAPLSTHYPDSKPTSLCSCEFESRSERGVQHYVIKFVSHLWQIGGFLRVLLFPPPIKLTTTI